MKNPVLYRCDYCGGLASWCIDSHGDPWYICKDNCSGFSQIDLFVPDPPEPDWVSGVDAFCEGDDLEVSSSDQDQVTNGHQSDDLPF